ncbi:MAG: hypothetical protein Q9227_005631 [Pyrenula ochraceoflavens]
MAPVSHKPRDAEGEELEHQRSSTPLTHLMKPNMELLHHYTTRTCFTMTDDIQLHHIWQIVIPKQAFSHEFLLHGLLALAALHYRRESSGSHSTTFTELAQQHQEQALTSYIPLLQTIDEVNCHALFAFSSIIGALSYGFLQISEDRISDEEYVRSFADIFDLLIGATAIAVQARPWLRAGDLSIMMAPTPNFDERMVDSCDQARTALQFLLQSIRHLSISPSGPDYFTGANHGTHQETYASSIIKLGLLFPGSPRGRKLPTMSQLVGWPIFAGSSYITLLKAHDPIALVILAHYGAALHASSHVWWLQGLGARLISSVSRMIGKEWHPYLGWAVAFASS